MTTDWNEYLTFADLLLNNPLPELSDVVQVRIIISRAYYAAFHTARLHMQDFYGHQWSRERGSHEQVIDQFQRPAHQGYLKVWSELRRLKRYRVSADYHDAAVLHRGDAQLAVNTAHAIIAAIAQLP